MHAWVKVAFIVVTCVTSYTLSYGQEIDKSVAELENVQVVEKLGDSLNGDLTFTNQEGKVVRLADVISKDKPTIFSLVYFECPMLCTLVLNGLTEVLDKIKFKAGKDYNLISVSIDPKETAILAKQKQTIYGQELGLEDLSAWSFLIGNEKNVAEVADSVGFNFKYDEMSDEYAHPAVFMILTPSGKISRYFYGVQHKKSNLELALTEAGEGKMGSAFDKFLLYCYRYDPNAKSYVLFAWRLMRSAAAASIVFLGALLWMFWRKEKEILIDGDKSSIDDENAFPKEK